MLFIVSPPSSEGYHNSRSCAIATAAVLKNTGDLEKGPLMVAAGLFHYVRHTCASCLQRAVHFIQHTARRRRHPNERRQFLAGVVGAVPTIGDAARDAASANLAHGAIAIFAA